MLLFFIKILNRKEGRDVGATRLENLKWVAAVGFVLYPASALPLAKFVGLFNFK